MRISRLLTLGATLAALLLSVPAMAEKKALVGWRLYKQPLN